MSPTEQASYRTAEGPLFAEWIVEEADLHAATKALPGSRLALVRWPVAFFIAYVGVGLSGGTGVVFTLVSAVVITAGWVVLLLASRGTTLRRQAGLPQQERSFRLSIDGERVRLEGANGHAHEFPRSEIRQAKLGSSGLLLDVRSQVYFIPTRALRGKEDAWRAFVERAPAWTLRVGFTIGLWCFALLVAVYGFIK